MAAQADHRRWFLDPACAGMTKGLSMSPNVTLITLGVADVAKATAFYEQLGFKKSKRASEASVSFFKSGGVVLILKRAAKTFWGGYNGYFADPDGHLWEVAFNPHWGLDEDGLIELPE